MRVPRFVGCVASAAALSFLAAPALAQDAPPPAPSRDAGWDGVTTGLAVASVATQLVMPRVFYSDPETTVGFRARWHVSVLAPVLAIGGLTAFNELAFKGVVKAERPGCEGLDPKDAATPVECASYGGPSTHAFAAFAGLGQGAAVFLVDTFKHSDGRLHAAPIVGNVAVPLVLSIVTAAGRGAGGFEDGGQILAGAGAGLGVGALLGLGYALLQRPECPYGSPAICW